ncbi:MAG: hypothetical protein L6Q99_04120 [Planctomycetes bacterium]|nr:hypothetical protein [Planctomycetota bacterium]
MQSRRGEPKGEATDANRADVVRGLGELYAGFEVVDRELDLGEGRRVDWVGVDSTGRLVLVLLVREDGVEPVIAALDALAFVQKNRGVLAGHLQNQRLRPDVSPIVALVAESFSDRMLGRLSSLNAEAVRLFELRTVASARGAHVYLAPIEARPAREAVIAPRGAEVFLSRLDVERRALAELALKRIGRIDDLVGYTASEKTVTWRWQGELLCSLSSVDDQLDARIEPGGAGERLTSTADLEAFVDLALARYVDLLGAATPPGGGLGHGLAAAQEPRLEPRELLTPAELEAFRQPSSP